MIPEDLENLQTYQNEITLMRQTYINYSVVDLGNNKIGFITRVNTVQYASDYEELTDWIKHFLFSGSKQFLEKLLWVVFWGFPVVCCILNSYLLFIKK